MTDDCYTKVSKTFCEGTKVREINAIFGAAVGWIIRRIVRAENGCRFLAI